MLNGLEGHESRNCYLHSIGISLDHVLFSQLICFSDGWKNISQEVDLISQKFRSKKSLDNKLPVDEACKILYKFFILFSWNFPKVHSCCKQSTESLFHWIKSISVWSQIKMFNLGKVAVLELLENMHRIDHELDWSFSKSVKNIQNFLQGSTVPFLDGDVLEVIDKLLLWGGILELV